MSPPFFLVSDTQLEGIENLKYYSLSYIIINAEAYRAQTGLMQRYNSSILTTRRYSASSRNDFFGLGTAVAPENAHRDRERETIERANRRAATVMRHIPTATADAVAPKRSNNVEISIPDKFQWL
jgi:hypothetical protein